MLIGMTTATDDGADHHWERVADEWTAWARTPGHDAYWAYRDQFGDFLPAAGSATLDLGCGEGRVARDLGACGHHVTATDFSAGLLAAAAADDSARAYVHADAARLPFADNSFDRVVAYNMLMDVPDMPAVVAEAGRVLAPAGVLTISIVHPFSDRGSFASDASDASFIVDGDYFGSTRFAGEETRDGHTMHFAGWSHPLSSYTTALTAAGLAITAMHEPLPRITDANAPVLGQWRRLPLFLWINAQALP